MKKIYECCLSLMKEEALEDSGIIRQDVEKAHHSDIYTFASLTVDYYDKNDCEELLEKYRNYLLDLNEKDELNKEGIGENLMFEVKSNNGSNKFQIPYALNGQIYVTKTPLPNVVREIVTGQLFNVEKGDWFKYNSKKSVIIHEKTMSKVEKEEDYQQLKCYLNNKEIVQNWLNFVNQYMNELKNKLYRKRKKLKEDYEKKDIENHLKREEENKRINKLEEEVENSIKRI